MQKNATHTQRDNFIAAALFLISFAIYLRTLAPSVAFMFDDTLEFQYIVPRLGIIHQTGYPLYALIGKLFAVMIPLNDPAFRLNLLSALMGALAVAALYSVLRQLVAWRIAALIGALTFAFGQTFWSQAVIAETYTTQMLIGGILFYLALTWKVKFERGDSDSARRRFYALAFMLGLGLTHHRLILLLYPAIAVYVLMVVMSMRGASFATKQSPAPAWGLLRPFGTRNDVARAAILFFAPLLLYLYLPLRGAVGSADGTYENTIPGFFAWVLAQQYTVFLTQNPLNVQRDFGYYAILFQNQFGILGLALGVIGLVWLARQPREWIMLTLALVLQAAFVFNYRVANVYVHFLSTFWLLAVFVGAGADGMLNLRFRNSEFGTLPTAYRVLLAMLLAIVPLRLLVSNFSTNDLSSKWDVHDYGIDLLSQPTEPNATLIGILGEMTLVRYFQSNLGLRPDLQTTAADLESERLAAIDAALKQNRVAYLTRPLEGAMDKYALDSIGPLIRVRAKNAPDAPNLANSLDPPEDFGAVRLIGYAVDESRLGASQQWHAENGRVLRVTVFWKTDEKVSGDPMVSVKVLGGDRRVAGQLDQHPVRDAYPAKNWKPGEIIGDVYDVPIFLGAVPGAYAVNVTMYDSGSGAVLGSHDLKTIALAPDFSAPRRDAWNISRTSDADFGALTLAGYTLDPEAAVRPGDPLPLTLLWRASQTRISDSLKARVWLEDESGKSNASRDVAIGQNYPMSLWQAGQFVREAPVVRVPANMADGTYRVRLAVTRGEQLLGQFPFRPSIAVLGAVGIKNRARVMTPPPRSAHTQEATFDHKIRLLGYDFGIGGSRDARLTLYWKSLALMDTAYTVFVHLLDANDNVIASADAAPGNGEFATTGWIADEFITDVHSFAIPQTVTPGTYRVEIGWYDPMSGARLKTADGQDRVLLAPVDIP